MSLPLCSIIIPTLDEAELIETALTHLQSLRNKSCEIILVDGGSRDSTVERASPLVDRVITSLPGRAQQMNQGAAVVRGEWLLFLHCDTTLPSSMNCWLSRLKKSDCPPWGFFSLRLSGQGAGLRIIERAITLRSRFTRVATGDQALFVKRELFNAVGAYPSIPLMEDVALSKALRQRAKPLVWRSPVVTDSRRWQQNGILKTVCLMWWLRLAYFFGAKPAWLAQQYYGR